MKFFVPDADGGEVERIYGSLASFCGVHTPKKGKRIASIAFTHDGEEWMATVGQELRGQKIRFGTRRGRKVEIRTSLHDPARVLAIFEGVPYLVVTDARPLGSKASHWVNPFLAGKPHTVELFEDG